MPKNILSVPPTSFASYLIAASSISQMKSVIRWIRSVRKLMFGPGDYY